MKIDVLRSNQLNTGRLTILFLGELIEIKRGRYIKGDISHPLFTEKENYFWKIHCLEYKKSTFTF